MRGNRYFDLQLVRDEVWGDGAGGADSWGFDNVAWIAPMAVFLLATIGTGFLVKMWSARSAQRRAVSAAGPVLGGDAVRERIRRETEY
ncbi:hypothetical protein RBB78_15855 [Tunturiibacter empetritectus]|uniref:hypothetical protein n=1 Tax=Tunturiibacter empetritectus TaxID=3069691 RepID=UPI003D9B4CE4